MLKITSYFLIVAVLFSGLISQATAQTNPTGTNKKEPTPKTIDSLLDQNIDPRDPKLKQPSPAPAPLIIAEKERIKLSQTPMENVFFNAMWASITGGVLAASAQSFDDSKSDQERFSSSNLSESFATGAIFGALVGLTVGTVLAFTDTSFPYPDLLDRMFKTKALQAHESQANNTQNNWRTDVYSYDYRF